jgi:hypothetical protein
MNALEWPSKNATGTARRPAIVGPTRPSPTHSSLTAVASKRPQATAKLLRWRRSRAHLGEMTLQCAGVRRPPLGFGDDPGDLGSGAIWALPTQNTSQLQDRLRGARVSRPWLGLERLEPPAAPPVGLAVSCRTGGSTVRSTLGGSRCAGTQTFRGRSVPGRAHRRAPSYSPAERQRQLFGVSAVDSTGGEHPGYGRLQTAARVSRRAPTWFRLHTRQHRKLSEPSAQGRKKADAGPFVSAIRK